MGQDWQHTLALCITHRLDRDGQHGRVEGHFLVQVESVIPPSPEFRNPHAGEVVNGWYLQDLVAPAFYRRDTAEKSLLIYPDVLVFRRRLPVGKDVALAMFRTLARAERGLRRLREANGFIENQVALLFRLSNIFQAKVIITADFGALSPFPFIEVTPDDLSDQIHRWQSG
jgi:hypothetical protein